MPTISGRSAAQFDQGLAEGRRRDALALAGDRGDHRRGREPRLLLGGGCSSCWAPSVWVLSMWAMACCHSGGSTRMKWFLSRVSRKGTPRPIRVSKRMTRGLCFLERAGRIEGGDDGRQVVAIHALHMPAEGGPLVGQRLEAHDLPGGAVGLLVVDVDQADQVRPAGGGRRPSRPPRSILRPVRRRTSSCRRRPGCSSGAARAPCPRQSEGPGRASRPTSPCPACRCAMPDIGRRLSSLP